MFVTASDYHELNAGAHRNPPKPLSAPALIWHLAFWTNYRDRAATGEKKPKPAAKEIKDVLDDFILTLCRATKPKVDEITLYPCISDVHLLFSNTCPKNSFSTKKIKLNSRQLDIFSSTRRAVWIQFIWKKLDVTIRFEILTECFSISIFVELDKERRKFTEHTAYSDIEPLNATSKDIREYLARAARQDKESDEASEKKADELSDRINKYCFHDFWQAFESDIFLDDALSAFTTRGGLFGRVFADFRGFIASDQAFRFDDEDYFKGDRLPSWGHAAKTSFLPLIQHRERTEKRRYECAVNYMLDGRALYLSTLGPQLPSVPEDERIPVEFIVYAHQRNAANTATLVNKWQLGRMVSQILLLGTLRLCALKDVKLLHKTGQELADLEETTQAAREAIALKAEDDASKVDWVAPSRGIADAHKKLNDITRKFLDQTDSGLLYRIERSRYYVKQFDENVKLLRIQRVEGDQPYNQFIRRRLGSEFDFIDRLGIRYDRATRNMFTLDQYYLAISQNVLVKKATKIDEDTNRIEVDIQNIQEAGEFALLAVLVPYYVTHLIALMIGEDQAIITPLVAIVWSGLGAFALHRLYLKKKYRVLWKGMLGLLIIAAISTVIFFAVLTGALKFDRQAAKDPGSSLHDVLPPDGSAARDSIPQQILETQQRIEQLANEQLATLKKLLEPRPQPGGGPADRIEAKPEAPAPTQPPPVVPPQQPGSETTGPTER
jgi:hypothetical protein